MLYCVRIRNNETGRILTKSCLGKWNKAELLKWTQGELSCDRARAWEYAKIMDHNAPNPEHPCGKTAYSVLDATLPSGRVVKIED